MGLDSLFSATRSLFVIFAAGILGIVVLGFALRAARGWRQVGGSRHWPSTTGRVLAASVEASRRVGRSGVSFYPAVMYEYYVDGQRYVGNRISFGTRMGTGVRSWVESQVERYPAGSEVEVFYNPTNPADAVLEHGAPGSWGNLLVVVILVGALIVFLASFLGLRFLPILR